MNWMMIDDGWWLYGWWVDGCWVDGWWLDGWCVDGCWVDGWWVDRWWVDGSIMEVCIGGCIWCSLLNASWHPSAPVTKCQMSICTPPTSKALIMNGRGLKLSANHILEIFRNIWSDNIVMGNRIFINSARACRKAFTLFHCAATNPLRSQEPFKSYINTLEESKVE